MAGLIETVATRAASAETVVPAVTIAGKVKIVFVCLGNICRSPLALHIFSVFLNRRHPNLASQFVLDSAGTGFYDEGKPFHHKNDCAYPLSVEAARLHDAHMPGVYESLQKHVAKELTAEVLEGTDYLVVFDERNVNCTRMIIEDKASDKSLVDKIYLFGSFGLLNPELQVIVDPWLANTTSAFEEMYFKCLFSCESLFQFVVSKSFGGAGLALPPAQAIADPWPWTDKASELRRTYFKCLSECGPFIEFALSRNLIRAGLARFPSQNLTDTWSEAKEAHAFLGTYFRCLDECDSLTQFVLASNLTGAAVPLSGSLVSVDEVIPGPLPVSVSA